eukprot:30546-Chlamydomonas_euryale.AAC.1
MPRCRARRHSLQPRGGAPGRRRAHSKRRRYVMALPRRRPTGARAGSLKVTRGGEGARCARRRRVRQVP